MRGMGPGLSGSDNRQVHISPGLKGQALVAFAQYGPLSCTVTIAAACLEQIAGLDGGHAGEGKIFFHRDREIEFRAVNAAAGSVIRCRF